MAETGAFGAPGAARGRARPRGAQPGSMPGGVQPGVRPANAQPGSVQQGGGPPEVRPAGARPGSVQPGGARPGPAHLGRTPQQSRSREKVARILATTARLLEQRPYEEVGTKLIAAEAGVSVGILYRFFPDKEAIVASLIVGWMDRFVRIFDETAADPLPADPVDFFGRLIGVYADFFRREPGFRQVWYGGRLLPTGSLEAEGKENDRQLAQRVHGVLTRGYGMADTEQTRRSSYIAVVLADRMLDVAFRDNPEGDPDILTETVRVLARYLDVPSRGGDRAATDGPPGEPGEPGQYR